MDRQVRSRRYGPTLLQRTGDVATASLLENWIDETQRRACFLFETART